MRGCTRTTIVIKYLFIGSVFSNRTRFRRLLPATIDWNVILFDPSELAFLSKQVATRARRNLGARAMDAAATRRKRVALNKRETHVPSTDEWTNEIIREQVEPIARVRCIARSQIHMSKYVKTVRDSWLDFPDGATIISRHRSNVESMSAIICFRFDREYC